MISASPGLGTSGQDRSAASARLFSAVLLAALLSLFASLLPGLQPSTAPAPETFDLAFVPNQGQTDPQVRYEASATGSTIFFTDNEIVLVLPRDGQTSTLRVAFDGASQRPALEADDQLPGVVNYIRGTSAAEWQTNLPTFGTLRYRELYPGVALRYNGTAGSLKSTYEVNAGADPSRIGWRYQGASDVRIDAATGDLQIFLPDSATPLVERAPIAWQDFAGQRTPVSVAYALGADGSVGFELGSYNPILPLTIDPTLEFSTYIGGTGADRVHAVAVDPATGDTFIAGETSSAPFPGSPTSIGSTGPGTFPNVFAARVAANGSGTVYRTIIGGTNTDIATGMAVNGGIANLVGYTFSNNFPTAGTPYQAAYGGSGDMFALALDGSGNLTYGTYIGAGSSDAAYGVAASGNNIYVAGSTDGVFPNATAPTGGSDAIVVKIDKTAGPAVQYVTRLGGLFNEAARAIALDGASNAYVTGFTLSNTASPPGFPTASTPYQPSSGGGSDAFITQLNAAGTPTYSSYLGGSDTDEGLGIAADPVGGVVYITGRTISPNFPAPFATPGAPSGQDAFIIKINIGTNVVTYNRLIGSPGVDVGNAVAIDPSGAAYVVGSTSSTSFFSLNPLAEMAARGGNVDGFLTRYDPAGVASYSTRIGGGFNDVATSVATLLTPTGTKVYVGGYTNSSDFPPTTPPTTIQPALGGSDDGFLVRITNARPVVDLNDSNPGNGIDFGPVTWTEAGGAVPGSGPVAVVAPAGLAVIDTDNPTLAFAEVRFVASPPTGNVAVVPPDAAAESLSATLSGGITGTYNAGTGVLRLTGTAGTTVADFQAVLRTITYDNTSETPTAGPRLLAFEISDGLDSNQPFAFSSITVAATNDPPALTVPASVTLNEEGTAAVAGISVADLDVGAGSIQVTLTIPPAAGTLTATASGAAVVVGAGTSSLDISGSLADVNATLASVALTGALDFNTNSGGADAPATLVVVANDQGNTPAPPLSDTESINVTVNPINDAPVVPSTTPTVNVVEDTPLTISVVTDLGVTDAKDLTSPPAASGGVPLLPLQSITVTTPPSNGAISGINVSAGTFVYSPNSNFNGTDTFQIQVCDNGTPLATSACALQTVNVTVSGVNDTPSFTTGGDVTANEDTAYSAAWATAILPGPADEAGQTLTFNITGNTNPTLFSAGPAIAADGTLTFTPAANANGSSTITVVLQDNGGTANGGVDTSAPVSFVINVAPVNDAPSFTPGGDVTVAEDSAAYSATWATAISPGPIDEGSQTLTFNITGNTNPTLFSAGPAIAANGTLTFTPAANTSGSATITVVLQDNGGTANGGVDTSAPVSFVINVTSTNDAPSFTSGGDVTVNEDTAYSAAWATAILPGPADEAGQTLTFNITGNTNPALFSAGPAIAADGTLTFTPAPNLSGSATITVALQDNGGTANGGADTSAPQTFTITVNSVNDGPPIAADDPGITTPEDTAIAITVAANDADPADTPSGGVNPQSVSIVTPPTNGTATVNPTTGVVTYTPNANYSGPDSFTYTICDIEPVAANVLCDTTPALVSITVTPSNDPPTAGPDTATVVEDSSATVIDVLANDSSAPDTGETLTVTGVTQPANGTVTLVAGVVSYTPNPNFAGADTFTYTVSDGNSGTATGTVTVTVTPVNDAPTLDASGTMTVNNIPEDAFTNAGTLVSTIIATAGGDRITDPDAGALEGIAVTAANTTSGSWEYSTNGGSSWTAFSGLGATSATLLAADANTRVRFVPNAGFTGTVDPGITFVAWDQTSGTNGATGVDPTPGGGTSAFSTASETAAITVTDVNQAPVLDNTADLALNPIAEDIADTLNNGTLVSAILASAGGDPITDGDTSALEGIAIIATDSTNGVWQFSTDGGATWADFGTPSDAAAVLLASDASTRIRFVPAANFNGTIDPGITFRAWDQTSGTNGATGIDVSTNGGITAFSIATETAAITVTPVNDPPTAVDDSARVIQNSSDNPIDVLVNDGIAPDTGETLTITAVGAAQHGIVQITGGGTGLTYTPVTGYEGPDSFTYTISDGNGGTATATVTIQVGRYFVSLPLVLGSPLPSDLVVTDFRVTPATGLRVNQQVQISATVRNNGTLETGGFWVDLYINPSKVPDAANIPWETICTDPCIGIAWYVESGLRGGESITLTSTPDSYFADNTRWEGTLPGGEVNLIVYADSWNGTIAHGAVAESDETNNRAILQGLSVGGPASITPSTLKPIPPRPLPSEMVRRREDQ